ncbi:MAG: hypothetical protein RJB61_221 [Actinomycetota bacterium]
MSSALQRSLRGISPSVLISMMRTFGDCFSGQRVRFFGSMALALGATAIELLKPWPTKVLFDRVLLREGEAQGWLGLSPTGSAVALAATVVILSLIGGLLTMKSTLMVAEVGRRVSVRVRRRIFEHMHKLDLPFHTSAKSGDLIVRLTSDVMLARTALVNSWLALADSGALMLGMAIVLIVLDPILALCALAPLPLLGLSLTRSSRELRVTSRKQRRKEGSATSFALESLRQFRVVKAYAQEESAAQKFGRMTGQGERAGLKATKISARMTLNTDIMSGAGLALVMVVGSLRVLSDDLSPGELLVATTYARSMFRPVRKASREGGRLSKASTGAERILEVMNIQPTASDGGRDASSLRGDLEFRGVRSTYDGEVEALRGMSFALPAGSVTVIEGSNGSGKSTMLSVLLRLTPVEDGVVLVDGTPIEEFDLSSYRSCFAYVPQEIHLFDASVRENILFGRPDATDDEIVEAAQAAFFDEVVDQLPDGYETIIGEGGASLSGGQARRLMLARAALRNSRILILDEPLSGLDPEARDHVAASVKSISVGRTTVVVNHVGSEVFDPDIVLHVGSGMVTDKITFRNRPSRVAHGADGA